MTSRTQKEMHIHLSPLQPSQPPQPPSRPVSPLSATYIHTSEWLPTPITPPKSYLGVPPNRWEEQEEDRWRGTEATEEVFQGKHQTTISIGEEEENHQRKMRHTITPCLVMAVVALIIVIGVGSILAGSMISQDKLTGGSTPMLISSGTSSPDILKTVIPVIDSSMTCPPITALLHDTMIQTTHAPTVLSEDVTNTAFWPDLRPSPSQQAKRTTLFGCF